MGDEDVGLSGDGRVDSVPFEISMDAVGEVREEVGDNV